MSRPHGAAPLIGAMPSLEASNQAQIEDLVQRNATLNHTIQKLNEQIDLERKRGTAAVNDIKEKWQANQQEWKEGCEDVLSSYRIIQKTLEYELAKERSGIYHEMAATREEKLLRLQREFKISLFQMKEGQLEDRIEQMEDEHQSQVETLEAMLDETKRKCAEYVIKYKDGQALWSRAQKERDDKEASDTKLRSELSNLAAASETLKSKLERTKLQLDGSQTRITDLERTNDELQRTNKDLTRQLEQWKNLETREGEAAEEQRKHRLALEVELRTLKDESQQREEEHQLILSKNTRKIEKLNALVSQLQDTIAETEKEASSSSKDVSKLQKQVERLKAELENERARVRPPTPQKKNAKKTVVPDVEEDSSAEDIVPAPAKAGRRNKPSTTSKDETTAGKPKSRRKTPPIAKKSAVGKPPKPYDPPSSHEVDDSEIEEIPAPAPPKKPTKSKEQRVDKGKGKRKEVEEEAEDEDEPAAPPPKKAKRKGRTSDDDAEDNTRQASKSKTRAPSEQRDPPAKNVKGNSRAASRQPQAKEQSEPVGTDGENKKKKRKINIFPTAPLGGPQASLGFGDLNALDGNLNIPTVLSPVKDDELVPTRSSNSMISSLLKLTSRR